MSKRIINGIFVADIHFGALSAKVLYKSLKRILKRIDKDDTINLIVIGGDLFDTKLFMTSEAAMYALNFINQLVERCISKGIALRIIRGTLSHDFNQLDSLMYLYDNQDLDIKIMDKFAEEKFKGFKLLYLPEEYMKNQYEYYADVFLKEYDTIFVHGSWDFCNFSKKIQHSESQMKNAPILDSKKFMKICKGPILSGHYHTYTNFQNKIYYSGSLERWCQGEESPKGYLTFNISKEKYSVKFIENKKAQIYKTLNLNEECSYTKVNKLKNFIKEYQEENCPDKLRIDITINEQITEDTVLILREYFKEDKSISFLVTSNELKLKEKQEKSTEEVEKFQKYKEIIEAEDVCDSIFLFLKNVMGIHMEKETIQMLVSNNIQKTL